MSQQTYEAVFADGYRKTRRSARPYTHAYRITVPNVASAPDPAYWCVGFSTTAEGARTGAERCVPKDGRKSRLTACTIEIVEVAALTTEAR